MIETQHDDLHTAITHLQTWVDQLTDWYAKWKLTLNTSKTETKLFILRRKLHQIQPISVNKTQISWTPTDVVVKYPGLYLDTSLNWNIVINKTDARLYKLYPLSNSNRRPALM